MTICLKCNEKITGFNFSGICSSCLKLKPEPRFSLAEVEQIAREAVFNVKEFYQKTTENKKFAAFNSDWWANKLKELK